MEECPEEMQYICKKDKVNQEERIWERKYKTTVIELEELKEAKKWKKKRRHGEEICQHKRSI